MLLLSMKHIWPLVLPKLEGWEINCSLSAKYDVPWAFDQKKSFEIKPPAFTQLPPPPHHPPPTQN